MRWRSLINLDLPARCGIFIGALLLLTHNLSGAENEKLGAADFKSLTISSSLLDKLPPVVDGGENLATVDVTEPQPNNEAAASLAFKLFQPRKQYRWQPKWYQEGAGGVRIAQIGLSEDGSVMIFGEVYGAINGPYSSRLVLMSVKNRRILKIIDLPNLLLTDFSWQSPETLQLFWHGQSVLRQEDGIISGVINLVTTGDAAPELVALNKVKAPELPSNKILSYMVKLPGGDYYSGQIGGKGVLHRGGFDNILTDNGGLTAAFDAKNNKLLLTIRKSDQLQIVNPADLSESEIIQPDKIKPRTRGAIRGLWVDNSAGGYLIFDENGTLYHLGKEKKRWKKTLIFSAWR